MLIAGGEWLCWLLFYPGCEAGEEGGDEGFDEEKEDGGNEGPGDNSLTGGEAEVFDEFPRVGGELADQLGDREGDGIGLEDPLACADEDEDEGKVEGIDCVAGDLDDGLIQLEEPRGDEAEEGGAAHDGEDAEDNPGGNGPAEFVGGDALGELVNDGLDEPALPPGRALFGFVCGGHG